MGMFDNVVVLGAGGMLGRQIVAELTRRGIDPHAFRRAELDIGDFDALRRRLDDIQPSLIVNCAAFTKVDDCETQPDLAMRINGEAVGVLGDVARRHDALLVHISSDYVFAGDGTRPYREDDPTGPPERLSVYGRSKLDGEQRLLASGCRHLMVRTSWIFGPAGPNFVDTIRKAAASRPELRVVNDQRGRPTYTLDLAAGIFSLLDRGAEGIVHVANSGECTWYEFACEIVRQSGLATPVLPCTTAEFARPARRPVYSVLDLTGFAATTNESSRPWPDALREYLTLPRARH